MKDLCGNAIAKVIVLDLDMILLKLALSALLIWVNFKYIIYHPRDYRNFLIILSAGIILTIVLLILRVADFNLYFNLFGFSIFYLFKKMISSFVEFSMSHLEVRRERVKRIMEFFLCCVICLNLANSISKLFLIWAF